MMVTQRYCINVVEIKRGRYFDTSCGPVPLASTTCPENKKAGVVGMGCGHLGSASDLNSEPVGACGSASRGRVLPIPPFG